MRYAILLVPLIALLALGCEDGEEQAPPTPTATVSDETTPPAGETGGIEGFRAFARQIERAISESNAQFFIERAVLKEEACTGEEQLGPCAGRTPGTVRGIPGRVWQSDASALFSPEEYAQALGRYFDAALSDQSDEYGTGALTLYALGQSATEGDEVFQAITTAIVDIYPSTGAPIGRTEREAHAFNFKFEAGRWQFTGEVAAVVSLSSADWLSGECGECYTRWERWQANDQ